MKPEQLEKILQSIDTRLEAGIEKNVNGKIRILTEKVTKHFEDDKQWKEDYQTVKQHFKDLKIFVENDLGI